MVTGISITAKPYKTVYRIGELFDSAGMVVTAAYENGTEAVVTDYEISGFDSASAGVKHVIITFEECKVILDITVQAENGEEPDDGNKPDDGEEPDDGGEPDDGNRPDDGDEPGGGGNSGSGSSGGGSGSGNRPRVDTTSTVTGTWMQDATGWWFAKTTGGYVKAEWAQINGIWYYFDEDGYRKTGWILYKDQWYFLNTDGSMVDNNWTYYNNQWYFLQPGGAMRVSGWVTWNGRSYYINGEGIMAVSTTTPDGYQRAEKSAWYSKKSDN